MVSVFIVALHCLASVQLAVFLKETLAYLKVPNLLSYTHVRGIRVQAILSELIPFPITFMVKLPLILMNLDCLSC